MEDVKSVRVSLHCDLFQQMLSTASRIGNSARDALHYLVLSSVNPSNTQPALMCQGGPMKTIATS